jgi:hypothetical protein
MIPKYRKQAVTRLAIVFAMLIVAIFIAAICEKTDYQKFGYIAGFSLLFGSVVLYIFGCIAWAQAKGLPTSIPSGIIAVCIVFMFCIPLIPFFIMFIVLPTILFTMKDRTARERSGEGLKWLKKMVGFICVDSAVVFGLCFLAYYLVFIDPPPKWFGTIAVLSLLLALLSALAWIVMFCIVHNKRNSKHH